MVVRQHRRLQLSRVEQVATTAAQVATGGQRGVVHVVRVADAVAVAVSPGVPPGSGNELHRPNGTVQDGVAVQRATIGV